MIGDNVTDMNMAMEGRRNEEVRIQRSQAGRVSSPVVFLGQAVHPGSPSCRSRVAAAKEGILDSFEILQ